MGGGHGSRLLSAIAVLAMAAVAVPAAEPTCDLKLAVQLTPDVPDARSSSFLSSLVGDPGYQLIWLGHRDDQMTEELELMGPGPGYRCDAVVAAMRKDARVQSIRIRGSDADSS